MLKDKQEQAVKLLVEGNETITQIAIMLEINRGTIYDWLKKKDFNDKLDEMNKVRDQYLRQGVKDDAETYLNNIKDLTSQSDNDMVKLRANEKMLSIAGWENENEAAIKTEDGSRNRLKEMLFKTKG